MFDPGIKVDNAVIDMFSNGTGAVVGWTGTIILLANAVVLYFRRQIWLEALSLLFLLIPLFLVFSAGENLYSVARHGIAYYINIVVLIVMTPCFIADYLMWTSGLKKPGRLSLIGLILLACAHVLPMMFSLLSVRTFLVLTPIGIFCLISGLLGLVFRKKSERQSSYEEDTMENASEEAASCDSAVTSQNDSQNKRTMWIAIGSLSILAVVLLCMLFAKSSNKEEPKRWVVREDGAEMFQDIDGYLGKNPIKTLSDNSYVDVELFTTDSIWAFGTYSDPYEDKKYKGYVAKEKLITHQAYLDKVQQFIDNHSNNESESAYTVDSDEMGNAASIVAEDETLANNMQEPEGDEYKYSYKGFINGKYEIEMTLTTDGGAYYTGEYFYTKNKTLIQLNGQLTDDYEHLVLEEYVNNEMTGKFEGTLSPEGYHGTWTSTDGETSYPFNVTVK